MNHQQLKALTPELKPYKRGLGGGLSILVDPKGRKYFTGRIKGQSLWIGTFGDKPSQQSLSEARKKFDEIKNTATRTTFLIVITKEHNQKQNLNLGI